MMGQPIPAIEREALSRLEDARDRHTELTGHRAAIGGGDPSIDEQLRLVRLEIKRLVAAIRLSRGAEVVVGRESLIRG